MKSLFRGRRGYVVYVVIACVVTALTIVAVSKFVQVRREEALYKDGEKALAERNYDKAVEDFSKLFNENPKFKDIGAKLAQATNAAAAARNPSINAGVPGNPASSSGTTGNTSASPSSGNTSPPPGSPPPPPPPPPNNNVDLVELIPASLTGYETMGTQFPPDAVIRGYVPYDTEKVASLAVTVSKRKSPEDAKSFIENTSKKGYPNGGKSVNVNGKQGYFGTSNVSATLVWTDGSILYELVMLSSRQQPGELEDVLLWAAGKFPKK